jgi:hypothetical protein
MGVSGYLPEQNAKESDERAKYCCRILEKDHEQGGILTFSHRLDIPPFPFSRLNSLRAKAKASPSKTSATPRTI